MKNEALETALKMIEMHLGILVAKEEAIDEIQQKEKRKKRTKKFGNELAKMDGKLASNKKDQQEEDTIRLYTDLLKNKDQKA